MVAPVAHLRHPLRLPKQHLLLTQFPAVPIALGQAGAFVHTHHIVEVLVLQPLQKTGTGETTVGQNDGPDARWEHGEDRRERRFFELVLAQVAR